MTALPDPMLNRSATPSAPGWLHASPHEGDRGPMNDSRQRMIASSGLVIGAFLGMAGTFAPVPLRGLAWGLDGVATTDVQPDDASTCKGNRHEAHRQ